MRDEPTRRTLLRAGAFGLAAAFAGCSGETADQSTTETTPTSTAVTTDRATTEPATTAIEDPVRVTDLSVAPGTAPQAQTVTFRASVTNRGDSRVSTTIPVAVDSERVAAPELALDPGETTTVTHEHRPGRVGTRRVGVGDQTTTFDVTQSPESFVTRAGAEFALEGERYVFHGTNNDHVYRSPDWYVDRVYEAASEMGLTAIRTVSIGVGPDAADCDFRNCPADEFSFMDEPGEFDEEAFRRMDYAIYKAKQYGIRLVLPLVDNWTANGMAQYVEWSDTASVHDDFYTDAECRAMYKEFVEAFLTRENVYTGVEYRNDPTILIWELANEPQAHGFDEETGEGGDPAPEKLQSWVEEMSAFVTELDGDHLVSTGGHGFYPDKLSNRDKGEDFIANNRVENVDCCSVHMYPKHWYEGEDDRVANASEKGREAIRVHAEDAHETVGKPVYFGEFRPHTDVDRTAQDAAEKRRERATILENWYEAMDEHDVDGALHWTFFDPYDNDSNVVVRDEDEPLSEQYNGSHVVYPWDELAVEVLSWYSETVREKSS